MSSRAPVYIWRCLAGDARRKIEDLRTGIGLAATGDPPHVTLVYSRTAVDWSHPAFTPRAGICHILPLQPRLARFGPHVVLAFESPMLEARHAELRAAGASHDFPDYLPHVAIGLDPEGRARLPSHAWPDLPIWLSGEERKPAKISKIPDGMAATPQP